MTAALMANPLKYTGRATLRITPPASPSRNVWPGCLLPQLLATHRDKYVAVHNEQVVDSGDDKVALALRVLVKVGNVPVHVGRVSEKPEPMARSGVRRELSVRGDAL